MLLPVVKQETLQDGRTGSNLANYVGSENHKGWNLLINGLEVTNPLVYESIRDVDLHGVF